MKELKQNKVGDANTMPCDYRRAIASEHLIKPTYATFTLMASGLAFSNFGRWRFSTRP
jgi:hypothetical protein